MHIIFYGAARVVTGSCYLLEHQGSRFLVDCGLFQGNKALKERNYNDFPFNPAEIDFVILTHAHIDHSGLLPKLYTHGFKGPIYATDATVDLAEILLPDCAYIQEMEVERKNRKLARAGSPLLEPIYTVADAQATQGLFQARCYEQSFCPTPEIEVLFRDAGHILGSATVEIRYQEQGQRHAIAFTGDLGRYGHAIVNDPTTIPQANFLVMESTYGNRLHGESIIGDLPQIAEIINNTMRRGGNVIIPAFAVDRTQDILMVLYFLFESKRVAWAQVYLDSPLAVKATEIFARYPNYFDAITSKLYQKEGKAPFLLDNLTYVTSVEESIALNKMKGGGIIISASGMADAGRIKHHLKHNLWRKESSVLFIGYQAEGTLGRRLTEGEKKVTIHGEEIEVRAEIHSFDGFSAHADREELLTWLSGFQQLPEKIFVTHGEEQSALDLAAEIGNRLHIATEVPNMGDVFELAAEVKQVAEGAPWQMIIDEHILLDINLRLQQMILAQDYEGLIRLRDYLQHNC